MPSRAEETCATDNTRPPKPAEVTCVDPHSCCAVESAERFSERANLMVNIGLTLQKR